MAKLEKYQVTYRVKGKLRFMTFRAKNSTTLMNNLRQKHRTIIDNLVSVSKVP